MGTMTMKLSEEALAVARKNAARDPHERHDIYVQEDING